MIFENFILHFAVVIETPLCSRYDYSVNIAEKVFIIQIL